MVIEGPHRSEMDYEETGNRAFKCTYSPHEPGIYILNVRFADEHIKGKDGSQRKLKICIYLVLILSKQM